MFPRHVRIEQWKRREEEGIVSRPRLLALNLPEEKFSPKTDENLSLLCGFDMNSGLSLLSLHPREKSFHFRNRDDNVSKS